MNSNLFVGGFPYETTERELTARFGACGEVKSVRILLDRETGRPRGLAFVEMATEEGARAARAKLNGSAVGSRTIFVTEAREKGEGEAGPAPKPGFVERRAGRDRRKGWGPLAGGQERRERPAWGDKKPSWRDKKPSWGDKKPAWGDKPAFGQKKPWQKKFGDKPREDKPSFGQKKPWQGKPGDKPKGPRGPENRRKKWGPGGPGGGNKWGKPRKFGPR